MVVKAPAQKTQRASEISNLTAEVRATRAQVHAKITLVDTVAQKRRRGSPHVHLRSYSSASSSSFHCFPTPPFIENNLRYPSTSHDPSRFRFAPWVTPIPRTPRRPLGRQSSGRTKSGTSTAAPRTWAATANPTRSTAARLASLSRRARASGTAGPRARGQARSRRSGGTLASLAAPVGWSRDQPFLVVSGAGFFVTVVSR